jgi:hypothetical protein
LGWQIPTAHAPVVQLGVACCGAQGTLHPPQLLIVVVLVSQPVDALPSQSAKPALQLEIAHAEEEHIAVAFISEQLAPHAEQLFTSDERSVWHVPVPRQSAVVPEQLVTVHPEAVQVGAPKLVGQTWPQVPQLFLSLAVLTSQPSPTLVLQSAKPGLQKLILHVPDEQSPTPLFGAHAALQAPQSFSDLSDASQPFVTSPSQSA